jgi:hypothetical protein
MLSAIGSLKPDRPEMPEPTVDLSGCPAPAFRWSALAAPAITGPEWIPMIALRQD